MADFNTAFNITLGHEGGYQAIAADTGNYNADGVLAGTKYGITPDIYQEFFLVTPSAQDMKDLTLEEAKAIYKRLFWDAANLSAVINQHIATQVFDMRVNHGRSGGTKMLQRSISELGNRYITPVDGVLGPDTLYRTNLAISEKGEAALSQQIFNQRKALYDSIVAARPDQGIFYNGWIDRISSFLNDNPGAGVVSVLLVGLAVYVTFKSLT